MNDGFATERRPSGNLREHWQPELFGAVGHGRGVDEEPEGLPKLAPPLLNVPLDVSVIATVSRTSLKQKFSNPSDIAIKEAICCFPLYDGSTVISFRCQIGKSF